MAGNIRFDCFDVDMAAGQLFKRGLRVRLRDKSFQVLALLVEHAGEVVTREDLQHRLWPENVFVDFDNNLNAAVGRLREALGDSAAHPRFIETLPRHGYRFLGTVSDAPPTSRPAGAMRWWRPAGGLEVPGTPFVLEEKLGAGGFGEVWLGRHPRLKTPRVFKFCVRADRVRALKREMTLFRVWRARVGDHPHLVQLLGVRLDRRPFYLEEEYVPGRDLRTWCAAQGGVGRVPVELRLELMAQAAEGLAAAHEAGIIHRDIKPGNILVGCPETGGTGADTPAGVSPTAKLTDFGVGHVVSAEALAGITATGLTSTLGAGMPSGLIGTYAYLAPEVLMGRPASVQSDLYSMGVVLYQLLVEDFTQPVTTDWARAIPDAVEQEDLQRCFAGRPEERFASARELAEHLRSISARRETRASAARAAFEQGSSKIASLAVQDDITRAIAAALMPKAASGRPTTLVKPYTASVDAYELCLRARYHHQKRTPAGLGMALRLFEQALARDADCALAHAGIAHVCLITSYFGGMPTREGMVRMKAAALRAVELDETLAVAHVRLADALCFEDWDWAGAEREFLRALELDPDSPEATCRYGLFLWARQRHPEAIVLLRKAIALDPFSLDTSWLLGWVFISTGQFEEAEELARKMLAMDSSVWLGHHIRAAVKWAKGLWAEAVPDTEAVATIEGGPVGAAGLCWCYAQAARPAEARQTLARLEQMTATRIVPPTWMALAYDAVGADTQARDFMERAIEERHMLLVHLRGWMASAGWLSSYKGLLDEHGL